MSGVSSKLNLRFLSRLKADPTKTLQFFYRASYARRHVANVELNHFIARAFADVLHFHCYRQTTVSAHALSAQLRVSKS